MIQVRRLPPNTSAADLRPTPPSPVRRTAQRNDKIRALLSAGARQVDLAARFGITQARVAQIANGVDS